MTAELACAVLSYRDEPCLVEAVRSLLTQEIPVEVVVVNSGGGDPAGRLAAAGFDVPVYSVPHRLYPGAVRNLGIDQTRAPYVAFLAADCEATPGWAAARVREHRAGAPAVASVLTNAFPQSSTAWASLLLVHNRRLSATRPGQQLLYSLSYDRGLFDRFGRFDEGLRAGEDTEFNARFLARERPTLALDAITAHRYPTHWRAMLRDAFRRGRLQARMQGALEGRGPRNVRVALRGPLGVLSAIDVSVRSASAQRRLLIRSWPLMMVGAVAYTMGALTTPPGKPQGTLT